MTNFDDREKAQENKFALDYEMDFKIRAKRNKMLAKWAAERMAMDEEEAETYSDRVMKSCVDGIANQTILITILRDMREKGIAVTEEEIQAEMKRLFIEAKDGFR